MTAIIQTFTGGVIDLLNPYPDDINIEDIAHALALCNRFAGHTREPYSVAQHSIAVSWYCEDARWGLMHDATEAYLHDVVKPLKSHLPVYQDLEQQMLECIAERFDLELPIPDNVHTWDWNIFTAERRDLLNGEHTSLIAHRVHPWPRQEAETNFLSRFYELFPHEIPDCRPALCS